MPAPPVRLPLAAVLMLTTCLLSRVAPALPTELSRNFNFTMLNYKMKNRLQFPFLPIELTESAIASHSLMQSETDVYKTSSWDANSAATARLYCADTAVLNVHTSTLSDCYAKCNTEPSCHFISYWKDWAGPAGGPSAGWCRTTNTCRNKTKHAELVEVHQSV